MTLRLATRGSALARWQAERTRELLLAARPDEAVELVVVESHGDRDRESDVAALGRVGVFTAAIDAAVLGGRADAGVHSLKDMTTTLDPGLALAGVLARGSPEDVLVARPGARLATLPVGARVATGSARRIAMLKRERRDLELVGVRGNVETRVAKVASGEVDALVLARAGLERLGLEDRISEVLDPSTFVPAVGQGIVGLTCRGNDDATQRRLWAIRDAEAWAEALAERALLRALHGGCNVPVGARARAVEGGIALHARVLALDGSEILDERQSARVGEAEELGRAVAERLLARGAVELIASARRR